MNKFKKSLENLLIAQLYTGYSCGCDHCIIKQGWTMVEVGLVSPIRTIREKIHLRWWLL